jgi:Glyoxalase-like domain
MAARVGNITLDCDDALALARFWSAAVDRPVDDASSEVFASIGGGDVDRREPAWYFERVPEAKQAKNRMHLDLFDDDVDAVERLVALGASVVGRHTVPGTEHHWTVLLDPEGNEFCVAARPFGG